MRAEGKNILRRLTYSLVYFALIGFPLYRIYLGGLRCPYLYMYALLALTSLIILGLLRDRSELIIIYYVAAAVILRVNNVGIPSVPELLIYSLIILHGDLIVKALVYGIGLRKITASFKGYLVTGGFVALSLLAYLLVGYLSASLFVNIMKVSVIATSLSELVLRPFIATRIGSITIIALSAVFTSYILLEYLTGLSSDMIGLNPVYAGARIKADLISAYDSLISGKSWHDKLWSYSVTTFFSIALWIAVAPAYRLGIESVPYLLRLLNHNELEGLYQSLSFITGVILAYLAYKVIRGLANKFITPQQKSLPETVKGLRNNYLWLVIPSAILGIYVSVLLIRPPTEATFINILMRSLGLSNPKPGTSWKLVNSFMDCIPSCLNNYVQEVIAEFNWLVYIVRLVMNILWGA